MNRRFHLFLFAAIILIAMDCLPISPNGRSFAQTDDEVTIQTPDRSSLSDPFQRPAQAVADDAIPAALQGDYTTGDIAAATA